MGTNYFAHWRPPGASAVTIELHICKSHRSFSGLMFDSWQKWKDWLLYQQQDSRMGGGIIQILDEYGDRHDVETFIADVESTDPEARRRQTQWVQEHIGDLAVGDGRYDWIDADGFSFHRGEFF